MAELEFRDGKRIVPDYMETLMAGLPLHKLTYSEAVRAMDQQNVTGVIDRAVDRLVAGHFKEHRR